MKLRKSIEGGVSNVLREIPRENVSSAKKRVSNSGMSAVYAELVRG